jgi:hypothetical protein
MGIHSAHPAASLVAPVEKKFRAAMLSQRPHEASAKLRFNFSCDEMRHCSGVNSTQHRCRKYPIQVLLTILLRLSAFADCSTAFTDGRVRHLLSSNHHNNHKM